jgi:conjugative transfer signal peptidase TraF
MKRFLSVLAWLSAVIAILFWAWIFGPIKYNVTASLPKGFWYVHKIERSLRHGDIVYFCPPDTAIFRDAKAKGYLLEGDCPGNYMHMMKPVVALAGDRVDVKADGVYVNGRIIGNSKPLSRDPKGRVMKPFWGTFNVKPDEVWLISHYHPKSYDSRYFGAVNVTSLLKIATKL